MTFTQAIERYAAAKSRKRSLAFDRLYLRQLANAFGEATPLSEITAAKIAGWRDARLAVVDPRTGELYGAAGANRPLAARASHTRSGARSRLSRGSPGA
jgi:hypothetical protein